MVGLVALMVGEAGRREVCSPLRQGTGMGVRVLDVSVGICICGRVCLGGHDPGEGRKGRVNTDGQKGATLATMVAVVCLGHVKKRQDVRREEMRVDFLEEKSSISKTRGVKRAFLLY